MARAKRKHKRVRIHKPVAGYGGGTVARENLPFPIVYYPDSTGFFSFRSEDNGILAFCSCSKVAIENYTRLRLLQLKAQGIDPSTAYVIPIMGAELQPTLRYEDRLCHKCNQTVPSHRYIHEMYAGLFMQTYGWYVKQTFFRFGVWPDLSSYLPDVCPPEYQADIEASNKVKAEYLQQYHRTKEETLRYQAMSRARWEKAGPGQPGDYTDEEMAIINTGHEERRKMARLSRIHARALRVFTTKIENIVRQEFGIRKVGEGWLSETILYQIVKRVLPGQTVLFHHRPDWLNGLELDIYVPELKTAFEYQGIQHYKPIDAWGGDEALEELQERDWRKASTCKDLGIRLLKVEYTDPLTESYIQGLLDTPNIAE